MLRLARVHSLNLAVSSSLELLQTSSLAGHDIKTKAALASYRFDNHEAKRLEIPEHLDNHPDGFQVNHTLTFKLDRFGGAYHDEAISFIKGFRPTGFIEFG
jgi:hypothetical protein